MTSGYGGERWWLTKAVAGKRIAELGNALGMKVLVAARKTSSISTTSSSPLGGVLAAPNADDNRVPFDDVLRRATVLVLALPRSAQTLNLISTAEFDKMHPYAVLINIARGGIVDEAALVQALKEKRIAGYATDVYQASLSVDQKIRLSWPRMQRI
jgi:lactate dehydrogenase-like 2-hydroxyacid dehydrogenase